MAKEDAAFETYLAEVRAAMSAAGAAPERIADTERGLREHVDEALAEEARDIASVLAELDPPSAFAGREEACVQRPPISREALLGAAGLISGALFITVGFAVIPNVKPSLVGNGAERIIILGVLLALTLGLAGRKTPFGKASLLFGGAIIALIILTRILRGA